MPHLQKLFERIRDRKDIQVVTFNVDDNIGDVAPFMKENKYTFPVLFGSDLMKSLVPSLGIPLNWVVDPSGTVRSEQVGFAAIDKWQDEMLAVLEKVLKTP